MSESAIKRALDKVIDPELRLPITELDMVEIQLGENQTANITVKLTVAGCPAAQKIEADVKAAVAEFDATVTMSVMNQTERDALKAKLRNG